MMMKIVNGKGHNKGKDTAEGGGATNSDSNAQLPTFNVAPRSMLNVERWTLKVRFSVRAPHPAVFLARQLGKHPI